jgi:hypothetical protein
MIEPLYSLRRFGYIININFLQHNLLVSEFERFPQFHDVFFSPDLKELSSVEN